MVDPAGATYTAYNNMTSDDPLMVSSHGDVAKKWLRVEQNDYVKFANPLYFLQNSNGQVVLPNFVTT